MAQIGFVFENIMQNTKEVVFIETAQLKNNCIIGFSQFLYPSTISSWYFLTHQLSLQNLIYIDNTKTPYTKIAVAKKNSCYIDDLTVWLEPKTYSRLREKLTIEKNTNTDIITRINEIVELLQL